ncbi:MAG: ParA family protein [Actinomycetales bacterium]|nr:ParA family protein [Actinomycetales bacterium]
MSSPLAVAAALAVGVQRGDINPAPRPATTRILTLANQKGGVGKTTSTVNLAAALGLLGQQVLVVDADPQGNASTALGVAHHAGVDGVYDIVMGEQTVADVVVTVASPGVFVVPATIDLAGAEVELVAHEDRDQRLRRALTEYLPHHARSHGDLDYILIDCPPSLGLLTLNALVAAREVLIPVQCEYYALEGLSQLMATIERVRQARNPTLQVTTALLTMFDARTRLSSDVADEVRRHLGAAVLSAVIPRSVRLSEAPSHEQTIFGYDPGSTGAQAYLDAARELAVRGAPGAARVLANETEDAHD